MVDNSFVDALGSTLATLSRRERILGVLTLLGLATCLAARLGVSLAVPTAVLFLAAVPIGVVALAWVRDEPRPAPQNAARKAARKAARILAWAFVAFTWLPTAAIAGLFFLASEPWPLSLRHGPDTDHARELFERYAGIPPPDDVRELYARNEWAGPGEHVASLRFEMDDSSVIDRIAEHLRLVPVPAEVIPTLGSLRGPSWWPEEPVLQGVPEAYRLAAGSDPQRFLHLWIDRAAGVVYLQDVDIA